MPRCSVCSTTVDGAGAETRQQHRLDGLVLVAEHGDHRIGAERARELDRITDQRAAEQLVQHLRARRAHARPLPRREHDGGERGPWGWMEVIAG